MVETSFDSTMVAPMAAFDPEGHTVISVGSVSKRYWGGLRIGWIRASEQRIAEFGRLRAVLDMASPVLEQLAVTVLLEMGDGLGERRAMLRSRADKLISLVNQALPHWRVQKPDGGLALWVELPWSGASALAAATQSLHLRIGPGPRFAVDGAFERFVRLPFTLSETDMPRAVERLAQADAWLRGRPAPSNEDFLTNVEAERLI
jgi:DNA-binding transcriptional MocR family regulator